MKVYKHCGTFVLLTVCAFFVQIHANSDLCGSWLKYKDEKCFKIYDDKLYTFADAEQLCSRISDYDHTSLPIIQSKEEQEFLVNYLFKTEKKLENFWIGAKHDNNTFHWVDSSALGYTNWLKAPKNKTDTCVQMQAEEDWLGKWLDVPCSIKSLAVCQKVQWTRARLEKAFDEAKHQQQGLVAEGNKAIQVQTEIISSSNKLIEGENRIIEEANLKIAQQKDRIKEADQKLTEHRDAIHQANLVFEKINVKFIESAKVLNISLFNGCSIREIVEANISSSSCSGGVCSTVFRDQYYTFEMKFVANQDSQTIGVKRAFGDPDFTDSMNVDGCKYVKCPLVKGQEYSFVVEKYNIGNAMDYMKHQLQITLTGDKGTLACSSIELDVLFTDLSRTTLPPRALV